MKKNVIWLIIAVMAVTFIGLLYVQIMYMENMIKMRNEQFTETVMRCLNTVAKTLERDETARYLNEDLDEELAAMAGRGSSAYAHGTATQAGRNNARNDFGSQYQLRHEELKERYLYQKELLNEVVLNILETSSDRPIAERADSVTVRTYLHDELLANGIDLPFEFAIANNNGIEYATAGYNAALQSYSLPLFPNDGSGNPHSLRVVFPTKSDYIFSSIKFMLPSFSFTFILLCIFIYTIVVVVKQKKLNEIKNEFINNMTHEFNTPISSISLAAQMLNDDAVRKSPTMMKQAINVISDETKRLRFQVEKVLQLSMFDRKNATMKLQEADANAIIDSVINTFKLKVGKFGGSITGQLDAEDPIVNIDEMHFTNVIFNLLDNAIKYRREDVPPQLSITTANKGGNRLVITVADNGIGIKREDLKRIFEKFYRVSTGNRHDVKGFCLGLAYVHKMVTLFNVSIKAESDLGKGSKFIITLPLINN